MNRSQFKAASSILQKLLKDSPNDAMAHNLLGAALARLGQVDTALDHLGRAFREQPKNPFFAFNLGHAQLQAGIFDQAITTLKRAGKLKPDMAAAHCQLGDALRATGRGEEAAQAYKRALALENDSAQAHHGLGLVQLDAGDYVGAAGSFGRALDHSPAGATALRATIHANLGLSLYHSGQQPPAIIHLLDAVDAAPDNARFRQALVMVLRNTKALPDTPKLKPILLSLLGRHDINPRALSTAAQAYLRALTGMEALLAALSRDPQASLADLAPDFDALKVLLADAVFHRFLVNAPITDIDLEILTTLLRRALLTALTEPSSEAADSLRQCTTDTLSLAAILAQQGWLNEYVAYVTAPEQAAIEQLRTRLTQAQVTDGTEAWQIIAVLACYGPLYRQGFDLPAGEVPDALATIIRQQVDDVAEEQAIKASIPTLKPMEDDVSLSVLEQYEQNPYPRWSRFDLREPMPLAEAVQADLPYINASECPPTDQPRVLIAGCGTGLQTMKAVTHYRNASVLAIDLSRSSIAYGMRKLREYGIDSVEHMQADILDLDQLDEQFDVVESYGVIHHMDDTPGALRLLANRLKPGGVMYLGLYSEIGRQSIVEVRNQIALREYSQDDDGLRQVRRDIMREMEPALEPLLSPASDFWTMSDTRDLIFHVHEHRFTLLEIGAMLEACGLKLLGLALRNPADRQAFNKEFPKPETARDIRNWHSFEQRHPETFGDTYKIWVRKSA